MIPGLKRRVENLEARTFAESVMLHFVDGSTRTIHGDVQRYFPLLADGITGDRAELADDIRRATRIDETGGSFQLLASLLQGPNREGEEDEEPR